MEIREGARKRGHSDADILHAVRHVLAEFLGTEQVLIIIGEAKDGTLLEVGLANPYSDNPYVMHCMDLRPAYYRFLPGGDTR